MLYSFKSTASKRGLDSSLNILCNFAHRAKRQAFENRQTHSCIRYTDN